MLPFTPNLNFMLPPMQAAMSAPPFPLGGNVGIYLGHPRAAETYAKLSLQLNYPMKVLRRIKKDIAQFFRAKIDEITISPSKSHIGLLHALVVGPKNTPYEDGLFLLQIFFPQNYPKEPLVIYLLNTSNGTVRFGPNLYANGMICLSILNTWEGPNWTPEENLTSVLLSVQSIMNEEPYFNEPGYMDEKSPGASEQYNKKIVHETLRCAVCDILEKSVPIPDDLHAVAVAVFRINHQSYIEKCESNLRLPPSPMIDWFSFFQTPPQYDKILLRLQALKKKYVDES